MAVQLEQLIRQNVAGSTSDLMRSFMTSAADNTDSNLNVTEHSTTSGQDPGYASLTGQSESTNKTIYQTPPDDNANTDNENNVTRTTSSASEIIDTELSNAPSKTSAASGNMADLVDDKNDNINATERLSDEVRQIPSDFRQQLLNHVTSVTTDAHFDTCTPTHQSVSEANQRFERMKAEVGMPDLSKMNIDPSAMWQQFMQSMVPEMENAVKFAKSLPGFLEFPMNDGMMLVKQSMFEVMMCRMCMLIDHEAGLMFDPSMKMKCPREMVRAMPMGPLIDQFFTVAEQFNPLKLTDSEIGLFTATLVYSPERAGVTNKGVLNRLHSLFAQALYMTMKKNHSDCDNVFEKVMSTVPVFRRISHLHAMALKKEGRPEEMKKMTIHKEVFNGNNGNHA